MRSGGLGVVQRPLAGQAVEEPPASDLAERGKATQGRPASESVPRARRRVLDSLVGNTPLLELPSWGPAGVRLMGKAEYFNPSGSVKDRAALAIFRAAEAEGHLGSGKVLLDASSGNTGIAYAMLAAARGYEIEICVPANANPERKRLLNAYGATVIETDPLEGPEGAVREARRLAEKGPERYFYGDQYNNPANRRAHYDTTGPEVWKQTAGRVTHWVAAVGTGGTFSGTGVRLRELNPDVRMIAVQPDAAFHGIEGVKHVATSFTPGNYDAELADQVLEIGTEEAQAMARRLARQVGIHVGVSSGANVLAAIRVAQELDEGVVVTVLCDGGSRYLSESFWSEG